MSELFFEKIFLFLYLFFFLFQESHEHSNPEFIRRSSKYIGCYYGYSSKLGERKTNINKCTKPTRYLAYTATRRNRRLGHRKVYCLHFFDPKNLKKISDYHCMQRCQTPCILVRNIVALYGLNEKYRYSGRVCFCKSGWCNKDGFCDDNTCWEGIKTKSHVCLLRDCNFLNGQCKSICEADSRNKNLRTSLKFERQLEINCKCAPGFYMPALTNICARLNNCKKLCLTCPQKAHLASCKCSNCPAQQHIDECLNTFCHDGQCFGDRFGKTKCLCKGNLLASTNGTCPRKLSCNEYPDCQRCKIISDYYVDCQCNPGYELDESFLKCKDINECNIISNCSSCINYPGTYECQCPKSCIKAVFCAEIPKNCEIYYLEHSQKNCQSCTHNLPKLYILEALHDSVIYLDKDKTVYYLHVGGSMLQSLGPIPPIQWRINNRPKMGSTTLELTKADFNGRTRISVRGKCSRQSTITYVLILVDYNIVVKFNQPYYDVYVESEAPAIFRRLDISIEKGGMSLTPQSIQWFCTRKSKLPKYDKIEEGYCFEEENFRLNNDDKFFYIFHESSLVKEGKVAFWYYNFYVRVFHLGFKASARKVLLYLTKKKNAKLVCENNCLKGNTLKNDPLKLTVDCSNCGRMRYKWFFDDGSFVQTEYKRTLLWNLSNLKTGDYKIIVRILFVDERRTLELDYQFTLSNSTISCGITPVEGFAFETVYTLQCLVGKQVFKVTSNFCRLNYQIGGFLKYQGSLKDPIDTLVFGSGDRYDFHKMCIYVTSETSKQSAPIEIKVYPSYKYVPNFQFLNKDRYGKLLTLNYIGNAIEYLNSDKSTERLDVLLKAKHRAIILEYLVQKWEVYKSLLLRNEIIKLLDKLFSQPSETDPYQAVESIKFQEMVDLYNAWTPVSSQLIKKEVSHGYRMLTRILSFLLYAGYLTPVQEDEQKAKDLIMYVMDNLNYHGGSYIRFLDSKKPFIQETLVFTFAGMRVPLNQVAKNIEFTLKNSEVYKISVPGEVLIECAKRKYRSLSVQLVVFPYNPITLANNTLFAPTVSVSFLSEDKHLPLMDFHKPVKITIPSLAGGYWKAYTRVESVTNQSIFLNLPFSFFENTLYKVRFNITLKSLSNRTDRIFGLYCVAICNGTAEEFGAKNNSEYYELCYELYCKNINFYDTKKVSVEFTLPPMLTTKTAALNIKFMAHQNASVSMVLSLKQLSCQYWYSAEEKANFTIDPGLASYGCSVSPQDTNNEELVCLCYHLSTFSEGFQELKEKIFYSMTFAFYENNSSIGYYTVLLIWVFYFFLSIYAIFSDHKATLMTYPVDLADNYPAAQNVYMVIVETGARPYAGCEDNAFIMLQGTIDSSLAHKLKCNYYKTLQRGQQNFFLIRTENSIGEVVSVRVWLSSDREDQRSITWYVSQITVYDLQDKSFYIFLCDEWLAYGSQGLSNDITFVAASPVILNDFKHVFTYNFYKVFENSHVWFSIFTCSIQSQYTRFQRTIVCMLNTQIYLLTTLILQRMDTTDNRNANVFYSGLVEVVMTLVCGFMLVPVFTMLTFMFSECRQERANHILNDWNRVSSRTLSKVRKEDLKKEDLEYKLFGNNLNRAMKWFKSFHKDRSHKFIFFPIVDPEKLRESYLAKHPQMKGELKLGAREDPYDNLKPNTNISVKAKRNVPKAAESTDKGVRKKTKKVKQEKKATKGTAKHYKKTILKTRLFEKLHDVKAWQRKLKENKKNTDDKNVNFSNRSKLRMLRNQGEEGMLDLREEDPSNILDIYIAKKTRNNFLRHSKVTKKRADYEGQLPWWILYVAWGLLFLANFICAYLVVLFITLDSKNINTSWYLKAFATFCGNVFLLDPSLIIFYSFILSLLSRSTSFFTYGKLAVIRSEAVIDLKNNVQHHVERVDLIRSHPSYQHTSLNRQKLKVTKKIQLTRRLFFKIIIGIYLAFCSLTISLTVYDPHTSTAYKDIRKVLFLDQYTLFNEREELYSWMRETLIEEIYPVAPPPKTTTSARVFSRVHKFNEMKHLTGRSINYPCFTKIYDKDGKLDVWDSYVFGPEWFIYDTFCLSYNKQLALELSEHMETSVYLNNNYIGTGFTCYILFANIDSVAWLFATAQQLKGGGIKTELERLVVMAKRPIPYQKITVILGISMFVPAFAFFIFMNMKTFFYEGAGHYFSNIWNIINMLTSFLVLMLTIIIIVVLPGMEDSIEKFYHDSGDLQTLFYISGTEGVFFLLHTITFLSLIKLIELARLSSPFRGFIATIINSVLKVLIITAKLAPIFLGFFYLNKALFLSKGNFSRSDKSLFKMMFGFHGRSQVKINLSGDYLLDLVVLIFLISTLVKRCLNTAVVLTNLRQERLTAANIQDETLIKEFFQSFVEIFIKSIFFKKKSSRGKKTTNKKRFNIGRKKKDSIYSEKFSIVNENEYLENLLF